jgi:hypothetical protein
MPLPLILRLFHVPDAVGLTHDDPARSPHGLVDD